MNKELGFVLRELGILKSSQECIELLKDKGDYKKALEIIEKLLSAIAKKHEEEIGHLALEDGKEMQGLINKIEDSKSKLLKEIDFAWDNWWNDTTQSPYVIIKQLKKFVNAKGDVQ